LVKPSYRISAATRLPVVQGVGWGKRYARRTEEGEGEEESGSRREREDKKSERTRTRTRTRKRRGIRKRRQFEVPQDA